MDLMMANPSKRKGDGFEREVVRFLQDTGIAAAERVPLSGAAGGSHTGDIDCPVRGVDRKLEFNLPKGRAWLAGSLQGVAVVDLTDTARLGRANAIITPSRWYKKKPVRPRRESHVQRGQNAALYGFRRIPCCCNARTGRRGRGQERRGKRRRHRGQSPIRSGEEQGDFSAQSR
jgi:hypothetical protein